MASEQTVPDWTGTEWAVLDWIESDGDDIGLVAVRGDRTLLKFGAGGRSCEVDMGPDARDALREALDRAAMPGVSGG